MANAAPTLKRLTFELGGKSPNVIFADADLDAAVAGAMGGIFFNQGEVCCAGSRVFVERSVHDQFVDAFAAGARQRKLGDPFDPATEQGAQVSKEQFDRIMGYIEAGKAEGAQCITGGERHGDQGYFVKPTIFTGVNNDMKIAQEEIFGPVIAVIKARDFDHAIEIFNGTDYALTGGIFSRSPANIERARRECECGNFYINRKISGAMVDLQPFGGFKMSGIGSKAGGPDYLIQFTEPRCVTENTLRRGFAPSEDVVETLG